MPKIFEYLRIVVAYKRETDAPSIKSETSKYPIDDVVRAIDAGLSILNDLNQLQSLTVSQVVSVSLIIGRLGDNWVTVLASSGRLSVGQRAR